MGKTFQRKPLRFSGKELDPGTQEQDSQQHGTHREPCAYWVRQNFAGVAHRLACREGKTEGKAEEKQLKKSFVGFTDESLVGPGKNTIKNLWMRRCEVWNWATSSNLRFRLSAWIPSCSMLR